MKRYSVFTIIFVFALLFMVCGCSSDDKTLKITPSSLKFADVNLGDVVTFDLTLTNKYGKSILITSISIAGSNDFTITAGNAVPINLDKNAIHTVTVKFEPTTGGPLAAMLSILHDASPNPKEVNLTGNGIAVPRIKLSPTTYDFDKKLFNRTHTHDFEIENIGTSELNISNFGFTGAGAGAYSISAGNAPVQIQPGLKHTFTVTFAPTIVGMFDADLEVYHNAVNGTQPAIVILTGEGIDVDPQITLNQSSPWDFGSVATTMPSTQICEIENTGIDPLTVTSATLATGTIFSVDSLKDSNGNVINFPQVIAVGAKIMLAIKFAPTANTSFNDTLMLVHDGTNEVTPWDIPLTGEGRDEVSKTFSYTGSAQQWTIPAGVTALVVECYGAAGGDSGNAAYGGKGGKASAKVPVTPSDTLYVYVGGKGTTIAVSASGGWNGGGGTSSGTSQPAGSGGGGTDIRLGGNTLADRKLVAGAGAGGGYTGTVANGGNGGGLTGENGHQWSSYPPGTGGSQTAGGKGGSYPSSGQPDATNGTLGVGGKGQGWSGGGGGGGGGYYGGGGGFISGGGGGSSYYDASGNSNKSTQTGVRSGNGEVTFKY